MLQDYGWRTLPHSPVSWLVRCNLFSVSLTVCYSWFSPSSAACSLNPSFLLFGFQVGSTASRGRFRRVLASPGALLRQKLWPLRGWGSGECVHRGGAWGGTPYRGYSSVCSGGLALAFQFSAGAALERPSRSGPWGSPALARQADSCASSSTGEWTRVFPFPPFLQVFCQVPRFDFKQNG